MILSEVLINKTEIYIQRLRKEGLKIAFAESCTGGLLSYLFSYIPGASEVFDSSVITYSNDSKNHFLDIAKEDINKFGVVSKEIAVKMAEGMLKGRPVDIAISVTGIAGRRTPKESCENNEDKVGTIFIGKARRQHQSTARLLTLGDIPRCLIQQKAAEAALDLIF